MDPQKYIIPKLPAQGILSSALQTEDGWRFSFHADDPSKEYMVEKTKQDACPIFYQALKLLDVSSNEPVCDLLSEVFVYIDFTGIFNRRATGKILEQQQKAECMFRPEGIFIDFGKGLNRYLAFERSASMSRNSTLSFVREDMYEPLRERIMLGMKIGDCQLSKLYAYNALMLTSGERRDIPDLLSEKRIVVIDNPKSIVKDTHIITVEDDGTANTMRKYTRVETTANIEVLEFDGEGLVSKELAFALDPNKQHHSFQIRLPYIKGVVHEVDFKSLFAELNVPYVRDIWGNQHDPRDVDMILTKSMFKGFGWMTENGLSWTEYMERCRRYDHALYISGWDKLGEQTTTELNYQFLNTLAMTEDEFRPRDLPLGWDRSPNTDPRHWVTKTTEAAYYNLIADENSRQAYFSAIANDEELPLNDKKRRRAKLAQKNPLFLEEKIYAKELADQAEAIQKNYGLGKLLVTGDNRYLSDDLMRLLAHIVYDVIGEGYAYQLLEKEFLSGNEVYAPGQDFPAQEQYTLLRSPHIARNEEALVILLKNVGPIRKKYLSHLRYVLMVDSRSLIPERLGGADYDGDMIKTIADPLINTCVLRGYKDGEVLPVLKIPTAEPLIADAGDWKARFETVKVTFSNRVGLISNTALRSGILAYNESTDNAEREQSRKETETLAILTGLEIDSAKSGIRPDLSEFLASNRGRKSLFLRYKNIFGEDDSEKKWYEDSQRTKIKKFITSVNWDTVTANLERLPYYAFMLEKETKKHIPKPVPDSELFSFAKDPQWKDTIEDLIRQAIDASDNDDESDITRYENLAIVLEDPIGKHSVKRYWDSFWSEYRWQNSQELTNAAVANRKKMAQEARDKAQSLKKKVEQKKADEAKKAEKEKRARIKAYWDAHADEKAALDTEKKQLSEKKSTLDAKIAELDKSINACKDVEKAKVPSEEETDKLNAQIKELEDRKSKLGMFAGKEKKQIGEEIASLQGRIESLKEKIAAEKKVKSEEVQKKIAPIQKERDELDAERTKVTKRIAAIDAELTKDPEA